MGGIEKKISPSLRMSEFFCEGFLKKSVLHSLCMKEGNTRCVLSKPVFHLEKSHSGIPEAKKKLATLIYNEGSFLFAWRFFLKLQCFGRDNEITQRRALLQ